MKRVGQVFSYKFTVRTTTLAVEWGTLIMRRLPPARNRRRSHPIKPERINNVRSHLPPNNSWKYCRCGKWSKKRYNMGKPNGATLAVSSALPMA